MPSAIDPTKPVQGNPTTESVRENFAAAKSEIETLQLTAGVGPQGPIGPVGPSGTIAIGTVTTGNPGTNATVTNSGTPQNATFNFLIPRGDAGTGGGGITQTQAVDAVRQGAVRFEEVPATNAVAWPTTPNVAATAPILGTGWTLASGSGATGTYTHAAGNGEVLAYPVAVTQNDWYQILVTATRTSPVPLWGDQEVNLYFESAPGNHDQHIRELVPGSGQNTWIVRATGNLSRLVIEPDWNWSGNFTLTRIVRATTPGNSRTFTIRDFAVTSRTTNLMLGTDAGRWVTGSNNILIGGQGTGQSNTTGNNNTALGDSALSANVGSSFHTAIGYHALRQHLSTSNASVAIGVYCLRESVGDNHMVAIGPNCMSNFRYGSYNTVVGPSAMGSLFTGSNNIALGYGAGSSESVSGDGLAIANDCIFIGNYSYSAAQNQNDEIVIGNWANGHGSRTITLGNDNVTSIHSNVQTISTLSDSRVKANVEAANLDLCLDAVKNLPVSRWAWQPIAGAHPDRNVTGFMAEDLAKVFPKSVTKLDTRLPIRDAQGQLQMIAPPVRAPRPRPKGAQPTEEFVPTETEPPRVPKMQEFKGLQYVQPTELLPTLWGAVQRLIEKNDELERRLAEFAPKQPEPKRQPEPQKRRGGD